MKFQSHAVMKGNPEFRLEMKSQPLAFEAGAKGSGQIVTGPIEARLGEIPIKLRIPFLRGRRRLRTEVASLGGLDICIKPIRIDASGFGVRFDGHVGKEGLACQVGGKVACRTEFDVLGNIPGKAMRAVIQLADGDDVEQLEE